MCAMFTVLEQYSAGGVQLEQISLGLISKL